MKVFVCLLSIIAVVVLAINLGSRIPPDTVAMGMGVVLGALTSIPVSLLLGTVLARRDQVPAQANDKTPPSFVAQPSYAPVQGYSSVRNYPPVVIINPSAYQHSAQRGYPAARMDSIPLLSGQREFRVIGEEATA